MGSLFVASCLTKEVEIELESYQFFNYHIISKNLFGRVQYQAQTNPLNKNKTTKKLSND
ncbi:MAG: hypothetical protein HON94_12705 [Methylococcales bacterium]|nr:hypothetical protein [Methylococcales bacterium]